MRWLFVKRLRPYVLWAGIASLILNLALLIPSVYMLQVFDRVFSSRSEETLLMLSLLALLALVLGYFADSVRAETLAWAGRVLDRFLSPRALTGSLQHAAANAGKGDTEALRDIAAMRGFLASPGVLALFDAPWVPIYLLVIALMHPLLGLTAALGACLLTALAAVTERLTRRQTEEAHQKSRALSDFAQALTRNAEVVVGMGMNGEAINAWREHHEGLMRAQETLGGRSTRFGALARIGRQILQIATLALGAWLVIDERASPGIMIAATILLGRALQPVEQLIGGWKIMIEARGAWSRLSQRTVTGRAMAVDLTAPAGKLELDRVVHSMAPGRAPFIRGITFQLEAGDSLGIIGPSAAGKTTLIRLILGILKPVSGVVRLDGVDVSQWEREAVGRYIGYVPQDVELFAGSVATNIARLGAVNSAAVLEAASLAHAHEMIVRLPAGYDTQIGHGGAILSGGQRQRIALARALYRNPRFIVLDEPNANLDAAGELALANTLKLLKERGTTVVMVGHRSNLMSQLDKLAVLRDGCLEAFGRTDVILSRIGSVVRPLHRVQPSRQDAKELRG